MRRKPRQQGATANLDLGSQEPKFDTDQEVLAD